MKSVAHLGVLSLLAVLSCFAQTKKPEGTAPSPFGLERMPESLEVRLALRRICEMPRRCTCWTPRKATPSIANEPMA